MNKQEILIENLKIRMEYLKDCYHDDSWDIEEREKFESVKDEIDYKYERVLKALELLENEINEFVEIENKLY